MQKILPITRVIMRRVHWIFKDEKEEEEVASENGFEDDSQESYNDTESDHSQETESSSLETSTTFQSENPCEHCENSKVYGTLIMKCPNCFWRDYYKICPICDHQIPRRVITSKRDFFGVTIVLAITHKKAKTLRPIFIPPLKRRTKKIINFSSLSSRCVFYSFCHWFSIKISQLYLVSGFIVGVY